jgi:hypothetical protein
MRFCATVRKRILIYLFIFPFVVLGEGTLWHLQRFLQCINNILFEFTPSRGKTFKKIKIRQEKTILEQDLWRCLLGKGETVYNPKTSTANILTNIKRKQNNNNKNISGI